MENEVLDKSDSRVERSPKNALSRVVNFFRDISFLLSCDERSISHEGEKSEGIKLLDSINWLDIKPEQKEKLNYYTTDKKLRYLLDFLNLDFDENLFISHREIDSSILKFIETKTPVILAMRKDEYSEKEKQMISYAYKQGFIPGQEYVLQEVFGDLNEFINKYYKDLFVGELNPF